MSPDAITLLWNKRTSWWKVLIGFIRYPRQRGRDIRERLNHASNRMFSLIFSWRWTRCGRRALTFFSVRLVLHYFTGQSILGKLKKTNVQNNYKSGFLLLNSFSFSYSLVYKMNLCQSIAWITSVCPWWSWSSWRCLTVMPLWHAEPEPPPSWWCSSKLLLISKCK